MNRLAREYPLFHVLLFLLVAVLAYGTIRRLTAHAAHPPTGAPAARALADAQGQASLHIADADADVGPGSAESSLAQHPQR